MRAKIATQKHLSAKRRQAEKLTKQAKIARVSAKRAQEATKKVDDALKGRGQAVVTSDDLKHIPKKLRDHLKDHDVVFRPNEGPQTVFLESPERDVCVYPASPFVSPQPTPRIKFSSMYGEGSSLPFLLGLVDVSKSIIVIISYTLMFVGPGWPQLFHASQ